jgi:hypothetical protein
LVEESKYARFLEYGKESSIELLGQEIVYESNSSSDSSLSLGMFAK